MRIDKYLCDCGIGTRSEVKKIIKSNTVTVNDSAVMDPGFHVKDNDVVKIHNQIVEYIKNVYFILNKPSGYVTAREDRNDKTVMDLINENYKNLSPVGRLDKDTEGLLLITNDGVLNHALLSPSKHVDKTYLVRLDKTIDDDSIKALEEGVDIKDKSITLPAKCERLSDNEIYLTIHEGRYHQIKKMAEAVGNKVIYLKRICFGPLVLPDNLELGQYRMLENEEIELLLNNR